MPYYFDGWADYCLPCRDRLVKTQAVRIVSQGKQRHYYVMIDGKLTQHRCFNLASHGMWKPVVTDAYDYAVGMSQQGFIFMWSWS